MKKISLIYKLSFLPYLAYELCYSFDHLVAEHQDFPHILYNIFAVLSILAFIYQLIYIIKLGRRDSVSVGKSIGRFFLYLFLCISISILITYVFIYFKGYKEYALFASTPNVYYGFEAWGKYSNSWYFPKQFLGLSAVYMAIYFIVGIIVKKRKETYGKINANGQKIKETGNITFLVILPILIMLSIIIISLLSTKD